MFKKRPFIRHIRWLYHRYQLAKHYHFWTDGLGYLPVYIARDLQALDEIWRGER